MAEDDPLLLQSPRLATETAILWVCADHFPLQAIIHGLISCKVMFLSAFVGAAKLTAKTLTKTANPEVTVSSANMSALITCP